MKRTLLGAWSLALLTGIALGGAEFVRAQGPAPREGANEVQRPRDRQRGNRNGQFGFGFGRARTPDKNERDHESVKTAFREVVSEPHKATVRVMADTRPACLGCIVDSDGYILTKASELKGQISVKLYEGDNRLFEAEIIGVDQKSDLAMLKVDAKDLPVVQWRDSADVPTVGSILASPGLDNLPLAIGVVSVQPRTISAPSGILGIILKDLPGQALIEDVAPESGAESAGLKPGDLVLELNGEAMANKDQLIESVRKFQPGDKVQLKVKRGEEERDFTATLKSRVMFPGGGGGQRDFQNMLGGPLSERRSGFPLAIQHDTILTPQECGGPLVDLDGRAVGVNIARAGRVNSYALPASLVVPLLADLKAGKFAPPELLLVKRLEQLKKTESTLAKQLTELVEAIQKLQSDAQANELLKAKEAERVATEMKLSEIKAELAKLKPENTSIK